MILAPSTLDPGTEKALQARIARLKAMGFARHEIRPILDAEFGLALTPSEFEVHYTATQDLLAKMPELQDLRLELGEAWARQEGLLGDLLSLYHLLIQHFNAYMLGQTTLDDGTAVRMVKSKDLLGIISMITKLGQENVTSKMNALRLLPGLEPEPEKPPESEVRALMDSFIDDAEFEETDDLDDPDEDVGGA